MNLKNRMTKIEQLITETKQGKTDVLTPQERERYEILKVAHEKADPHNMNYLESSEFKEYRRLLFKAVQASVEYRKKKFGAAWVNDDLVDRINKGRERARQAILDGQKQGSDKDVVLGEGE